MNQSPPPTFSPSPSTPTSGDESLREEEEEDTSLVSSVPHPKRRAVGSSGIPQASSSAARGPKRTGTRDERPRGMSTGGGPSGGSGGGPKEELVDIALRDELRALVGDPFETSSGTTA
ncbi:hypothetical protein FRC02_003548 [Tulasnella sp. 418]|nr:hypothetical protein FRC02_003548 [Tulasnella sp. 418]